MEFSIERILPLIEQEKEKHEMRKSLLHKLQKFSDEGVAMLKKAESALGADDPVFVETLKMMHHVVCCRETVEGFVEKGKGSHSMLTITACSLVFQFKESK